MSYTSETITKSAFSVFDIVLQMQRIGLQAMTMYEPITSAYLDAVMASQSVGLAAMRGWSVKPQDSMREPVTGVADAVPNIETRKPQEKTVKVRRVAIETPVQQDVIPHTETSVRADGGAMSPTGSDALAEATAEKTDLSEVLLTAEAAHPVEEVLPAQETTASAEPIHEAVKRNEPEIGAPAQEPVAFDASEKQEVKPPAVGNLNETRSVAPVTPETQSAETQPPEIRSDEQDWH